MAPRTRKSQRLQNSQASEGSNESHASLGHSMQMDITKVGVVGHGADVQHIGDPTPPQGNLTGKGKRTFGSLDDSPEIPTAVPTPTPATKKARNVASSSHRSRLYVFGQESSFRPTHWNQDSYPTTEEDSANEDDIAALTQGNPSKFMASQIPSWLDPAFGARRRSSVSNTVRTGTSDNTSPSYTLPMPLPVPAGTTLLSQPRQDRAQAATELTLAWPAYTNLKFAPGQNRLTLGGQHEVIREVVKQSIEDLRASLIFNDAFPDGILATCFIRHSLNIGTGKVSKKNPAASSVQERLVDDDDYAFKIIPVLRARIPLFRSEVKDRCNAIAMAEFTSQVPADIIQSVDWQLSGYQYVYPKGPKGLGQNRLIMRSQPYRNSRIIRVIHDLFFTGGGSSFKARFDYLFTSKSGDNGQMVHEVPIAMVALVATALYASIYEWRTGVRQVVEFSTTTYFDVYRHHVDTLGFIRDGRDSAFHNMMAKIYTEASEFGNGTGTSMVQIDLDLLDEDE
ncbi:hypothetical protein EDB86DRAFT_3078268 [Lactarius hatsudake]|nr:hypothetical protein EDB86DRAFT_3078268 [Lactarius hatsudake]